MRIVLLTQSDPFYLSDNINYLLKNIPKHSKVISTVLFKVSPFGKKDSFLNKALKTVKIFGVNFFINYSFRFLKRKLANCSVRKILNGYNIPVIELRENINHSASIEKIRDFEPDLLISIAGNQIFKQQIIELAPKGCLNLHTALLPKYRGLMPSFWVLKNCEKETGVSVFFVDKGIDSGPILVQERIPIPDDMTQEQLIIKSKRVGMDALIKAIELIQEGNYKLISNNDVEKTYYSFPTRKDAIAFRMAGKRFY